MGWLLLPSGILIHGVQLMYPRFRERTGGKPVKGVMEKVAEDTAHKGTDVAVKGEATIRPE